MSTLSNWFKYGRCCVAFSLVECLVTLAIISILMLLSMPMLASHIQHRNLEVLSDRLANALLLTKQLAISLDTSLIICGSDNKQGCDGSWNRYWLIVNPKNNHSLYHFNIATSLQITWIGNHRQRKGVMFSPLGNTQGQQGRFVLKTQKKQCSLVLISSGRVRKDC